MWYLEILLISKALHECQVFGLMGRNYGAATWGECQYEQEVMEGYSEAQQPH